MAVASVIFTTYNSPEWLEKVLTGLSCQIFTDFEIVIADDGSGEGTRNLIDSYRKKISQPITHVWHEDTGFNKCAILNKAIVRSTSDYLVFTDGDCIPRKDFVDVHLKKRRKNYFLSGGAVRLPMILSKLITSEDIQTGRAFDKNWLLQNGLEEYFFKNLKLNRGNILANLMNRFTPTKATWNGGNASAWKSDILRVNGLDERMKYGAEDREFGERLMNSGIKSRQIRYSAICLHLDHSRGYKNEADMKRNAEIRATTKKEKSTWTDYGIIKKGGDG